MKLAGVQFGCAPAIPSQARRGCFREIIPGMSFDVPADEPAGAHVAQPYEVQRDVLRSRCEQLLAPAPFEIAASA